MAPGPSPHLSPEQHVPASTPTFTGLSVPNCGFPQFPPNPGAGCRWPGHTPDERTQAAVVPKSSRSAECTPGIQTLGTDARAENCPRVSPPPCPSSSVVLWLAELLPTQSSLHPMGSTTPFTGGASWTGPQPNPESAGRQGGREESGATGVSQQTGPQVSRRGPATLLRGIPSSDCPCAFGGGGAPASQTPPGVSEPQTPPPS